MISFKPEHRAQYVQDDQGKLHNAIRMLNKIQTDQLVPYVRRTNHCFKQKYVLPIHFINLCANITQILVVHLHPVLTVIQFCKHSMNFFFLHQSTN